MKNQNCLQGVMCHQCGNTERFAMLVNLWVIVEDEGTDEDVNQAIEWDDNTMVACKTCDHREQLANFKQPGFYVTFDVVTEESAEHGDVERHGWWAPGGWEFDEKPDEPVYLFDPEDWMADEDGTMDTAITDWAIEILEREGACHFSGNNWMSTEPEKDLHDGSSMTRSFHFHAFSDDQVQAIVEGAGV